MKAIGYAGAQLFRCRYSNIYSVVIAAPDHKTAKEAFVLWMNDRSYKDVIYTSKISVKSIKKPEILWAQVDMTQV